jgi:hypothetical protein
MDLTLRYVPQMLHDVNSHDKCCTARAYVFKRTHSQIGTTGRKKVSCVLSYPDALPLMSASGLPLEQKKVMN